jgi:large subunit ribosomal protein L33
VLTIDDLEHQKGIALLLSIKSRYIVESALGARAERTIHGDFAMAKSKEARSTIKLKSEASDHCYFTQKNRNNSKERISLKKYDPTVRKHVMYKEASKV